MKSKLIFYRACALLLSSIVWSTTANAQTKAIAMKRLQHLQRGISLNDWLTDSTKLPLPQLRNYITPGDIEHIKKTGFDHVRVPVGPELFRCEGSWDTCERVQILDQVVQKALSLDLAVIIDFHPDFQYTHQLATNEQAVVTYQRLWAQIADRYGSIDQDKVFLEVMNEFGVNEPYEWSGILSSTLQVVRRHAPTSTIIVSGTMYADVWNLVMMPDLPDPNLIYNFHYYEPHLFTHQGAWWSSVYWKDVHNLPFPSSEPGVADVLDREEDETVRWQLHQYQQEHWDAGRISSDVEVAADWAKKHNVPLMCDEFGVYRLFVAPEDRERWITAARTAFEKYHLGWTFYGYDAGFGVVYKENGTLRDDDAALRGLGLKK